LETYAHPEGSETDACEPETNRVHLIVFTILPLIFAGIMWAIDEADHDFVDVSVSQQPHSVGVY
jgi:hypothetical protein